MKIQANGINLFFDIEGAALRASGSVMREMPTVILCKAAPVQPIRFTNRISQR